MKPMPLISVVVPIYNAADYLQRCVQSLLGQTLGNMEFIFVDDCSTDSSWALLTKLTAQYPAHRNRVKIVRHEKNWGSATARNTGLSYATGKYIGWVDADDWVEREMFEKMYHTIQSENADLVWCNFMMTFVDSHQEDKQQIGQDAKAYMLALIMGEMQGMLWNKLIKREIFSENHISFLDGSNLGEDRNVLIKVLFYCKTISHLAEPLYHYMQLNADSITRDIDPRRVYEEINNAQDVVDFLREKEAVWVGDADLHDFTFRSKQKLLNATALIHFEKWADIFPETHDLLYKSALRRRHKILGFLAIHKIWGPVRFWINLKKRKAKI